MSTRQAAGAGGSTAPTSPAGAPRARRRTDPTMLVGQARVLTAGSVVAAAVGLILALVGSDDLAPLAFTSSSVVAIGLLGSARRADTAVRLDARPDRSPRTLRVLAAVLVLALAGTIIAAWTVAGDLAR